MSAALFFRDLSLSALVTLHELLQGFWQLTSLTFAACAHLHRHDFRNVVR